MTAVTEKPYTLSAPYALSGTSTLAIIDDIASAITAEAGPWSVVANEVVSTTGRQILLKSSDADMAGVKLAIFGGVTPHTANMLESAGNSTAVYMALHVDHAADSFDANFNAGQILTGVGFVPGGEDAQSHTSINSLRLLYKGDFLAVFIYASSGTTLSFNEGGVIGKDPSGNQLLGTNASLLGITSGFMETSSGRGLFPTQIESNAYQCAVWNGSSHEAVRRLFKSIDEDALESMESATGRIFVTDMPMEGAGGKIPGWFQQKRIGKNAARFTIFTDGDGQEYIRVSASDAATGFNAAWYKQPSL